jgi:ribulose-phosphate 3-epimerase
MAGAGRKIKLSPSMMCADFLHLGEELKLFESMGLDYLHMDIMDGHYVPNFTLGPGFCKALAQNSSIPLDIHLMIENADRYIPIFADAAKAGAERYGLNKDTVLTFHLEAEYHPIRQLHLIKSTGLRSGVAIDPSTPVETLKYLLPDVEMVCIMTVNPGYSGQKLLPQTIDKIAELSRYIRQEGRDIELEVDGNVSWENIPKMIEAGADTLVLGTSSLFDPSYTREDALARLRDLIASSLSTNTPGGTAG